MKQKICLVCDVPGWAFSNIANEVKSKLEYKYDIRIVYFDESKQADEFYELLETNKDVDLIHFFWRRDLLLFESEAFKNKVIASGRNVNEYIKDIVKKISTGVYDFLGINEKWLLRYKEVFNNYSSNYYVTSKKLYNTYLNITEYKKPTSIVHDICNWERYIPINLERFDEYNRTFVIGWVGNSARVADGVDLKGFNTIIKPLVDELKAEGYNIEGFYADRNIVLRTAEEMPEYYSKIDICICCSIHEGTPLPILEAMSSGVPVITTDVGIVTETLGEKQREYIIGDRANDGSQDNHIKEALKEKILKLYNNRGILKKLSNENIISVKEYDGGKIIKEFDDYFKTCLND